MKLFLIIKNLPKIIAGVWNSWFPTYYIERIAEKRIRICEDDACGFYDQYGKSKKAFVPGVPTCGNCGCVLSFKTRSLSSECSLADIALTPLWKKEMTEKEEDAFRNKTGIDNGS